MFFNAEVRRVLTQRYAEVSIELCVTPRYPPRTSALKKILSSFEGFKRKKLRKF
jgi:hypothetical protein